MRDLVVAHPATFSPAPLPMDAWSKLRFIQRVLEGNPPQADKDAALAMVKELREEARQAAIVAGPPYPTV